MSTDTSPSIVHEPVWTDVGNGTIVCGSCHGVPMIATGVHSSNPAVNQCVNCHALSVDNTGSIIFDNEGNTRHVNGQVDYNQ
jgi:hypothetical protein